MRDTLGRLDKVSQLAREGGSFCHGGVMLSKRDSDPSSPPTKQKGKFLSSGFYHENQSWVHDHHICGTPWHFGPRRVGERWDAWAQRSLRRMSLWTTAGQYYAAGDDEGGIVLGTLWPPVLHGLTHITTIRSILDIFLQKTKSLVSFLEEMDHHNLFLRGSF